MIVETLPALEACCNDAITAGGLVGMDTEFFRERTYRANLCLVQMMSADAGNNDATVGDKAEAIFCIDPLAIKDLTALRRLCSDTTVTKVFHAARQDIEVLFQTLGVVPQPVFDTQIAAAFCGFGDQLGYAALVAQITGVELSKTQTRTDWFKRPLGAAQLKYAEEDVRYLAALHDHLHNELVRLDRLNWFTQDVEQLIQEDLYTQPADQAWQRVKGVAGLTPAQRGRLVNLASWRETVASTANLPREWVLKDRTLIALVRAFDSSDAELEDATLIDLGLTRKQLSQWGPAIREALNQAEVDVAHSVLPRLTGRDEKLRKQLIARLKSRAESLNINATLLGSRRDVEWLIVEPERSNLFNGWRRQVIGEELLTVLKTA